MIELKAHTLKVQRLENRAAEKAGMRFLLLDEERLFSKGGPAYIAEMVKRMIEDVGPELVGAAKLGKELGEAIRARV